MNPEPSAMFNGLDDRANTGNQASGDSQPFGSAEIHLCVQEASERDVTAHFLGWGSSVGVIRVLRRATKGAGHEQIPTR